MATEVQEVVCLAKRLCDFGNAVGKFERLGNEVRQFQKVLDDIGTGFEAESALAAKQECDHRKNSDLACECLCTGHADFRTCVQIDTAIAGTCNRRTDSVTNGEHGRALLLGFLEGGERVCGFAGLANGDYERPRLDNRVSVAEFRSVFDFDWNASQVFDHVFADHACVIAGAASCNDDAVDGAEFLDVRVETSEFCVAFG